MKRRYYHTWAVITYFLASDVFNISVDGSTLLLAILKIRDSSGSRFFYALARRIRSFDASIDTLFVTVAIVTPGRLADAGANASVLVGMKMRMKKLISVRRAHDRRRDGGVVTDDTHCAHSKEFSAFSTMEKSVDVRSTKKHNAVFDAPSYVLLRT